MPLTAEDVKNRQFSSTRFGRGYEEKEVDDFLDEVEAELIRLNRENNDLRTKLQLAEEVVRRAGQGGIPDAVRPPVTAPVSPAPAVTPPAPAVTAPVSPVPASAPAVIDGGEAALRVLSIAQRTADETLTEARRDADRLLFEARTRADQLEQEAQEQHRNVLGNLESDRERLERKIDDLRTFEREYRTRLKSYLEGQLRNLDSSGTAVPGAQQPARPATPFAPVAAPPVPGAPSTPQATPVQATPAQATPAPSPSNSDAAPAGPPRQAPAGDFEVSEGPEVPPSNG